MESLRPEKPSFFHPASGAVILGLDWLAFGADMATGFLDLAVSSVAVFVITFFVVKAIQTRLRGDTPVEARRKALIGAMAAGAPFPIGGTLIGGAILAMSGLSALKNRLK